MTDMFRFTSHLYNTTHLNLAASSFFTKVKFRR